MFNKLVNYFNRLRSSFQESESNTDERVVGHVKELERLLSIMPGPEKTGDLSDWYSYVTFHAQELTWYAEEQKEQVERDSRLNSLYRDTEKLEALHSEVGKILKSGGINPQPSKSEQKDN